MLADRFTQIFRGEHREIRDTLLDLIEAFKERDRSRMQALLERTARLAGPHFRYEEEALYPALVEIFGQKYVESLLGAHDGAISTAKQLVELAGKASLSDEDVTQAVELIRDVLPHVSDCDGLSIMVERLAEEKIQRILDARERSNAAGVDLLRWSQEIRTRPAQAVA